MPQDTAGTRVLLGRSHLLKNRAVTATPPHTLSVFAKTNALPSLQANSRHRSDKTSIWHRHRRLSLLFGSEKEPTEKRGSRHGGEQCRAQSTAAERGCCRVLRAGTTCVAGEASGALWLGTVLRAVATVGAARIACVASRARAWTRDQTAAGDRHRSAGCDIAAGRDGRLIGHAEFAVCTAGGYVVGGAIFAKPNRKALIPRATQSS